MASFRRFFITLYCSVAILGSVARALHDHDTPHQVSLEQANGVAYNIPAQFGGSQLDSSAGLGEPLNVIISALSSPEVLTKKGLENWARSVNFSMECLGFHLGNPQTANLGDGKGWQNETAVLRYDYMNAITGSCLESFTGGNHFRYWKQATTGAYFLAASVEEWIGKHHTISTDGYDKGRDAIVLDATGTTSYMMHKYLTASYYVTGLLKPGTEGINHNIPIDGRVAVLTITKIA